MRRTVSVVGLGLLLALLAGVSTSRGASVSLDWAYIWYGSNECVAGGQYVIAGAPTGSFLLTSGLWSA
jgi:hypothetical protein